MKKSKYSVDIREVTLYNDRVEINKKYEFSSIISLLRFISKNYNKIENITINK